MAKRDINKFISNIFLLSVIISFCFFIGNCGQQQINQEKNDPKAMVAFLYFSDTQADPDTGDYSSVGELIALAIEQMKSPDLVIFGGDTVEDGRDADDWRRFWEEATPSLSDLPVAAVAGNHDNYPLLIDQFDYPNKAPAARDEGYFYSLDIGQVHLVMLDSNIMGAANLRDIEWLRGDLASDKAEQASWRIAVMHHPMWPVSNNPKDAARAETMREYFLPMLEEYRVDLILCGHQHIYSRSLPMSGETAAPEGAGIIQVMAVSGGKGYQISEGREYAAINAYLRNFLYREFAAINALLRNFLYIEADNEELILTAYDGNGNSFDNLKLTR